MAQLRIGISGWRYAGWRKVFYPEGLPQRRELEHASRQMNTIEINGTFYSLQRPSSYRAWAEQTPDNFLFAVKGPRYITHMRKLRDIRTPLANFFASGMLQLGKKLGPFLWQFPTSVRYSPDLFAEFMETLPRTTEALSNLAQENTLPDEKRGTTDASDNRLVRHAFEVRHPSFLVPEFMQLLRQHGAALVFADSAGLWPYAEDLTADFVYIRLHGAEQLYASGYTDAELDWWAERIRLWESGAEPPDARRISDKQPPPAGVRDVFVYFDNDAKVHAPLDAIRLRERLTG